MATETKDRRLLRAKVKKELTAPGGLLEVCVEDVLGRPSTVFKERKRSLRELLAASAELGETEYLVQDERRITYAEHVALVASVAAGLRDRYGVGKGDRVAILAANCTAWPISFWATVSLGGIAVAFNGMWTTDEVAYALGDSRPKLLIADGKRLSRLEGLDHGVRVLEIEKEFADLERSAPDAPLPDIPLAEDDPATILYTSGTTGRPKGAMASHRALVAFVDGNRSTAVLNFMVDLEAGVGDAAAAAQRPQTISLAAAPMFHLSGLYASIILHLAFGNKLVIRSGRFEPAEVLALMERERVTQFTALGSMGPRLAAHPDLFERDLSSVQHIGFGGAPASPALQERMRQAFPNARESLGIGYGSSETVTVVASFAGADYIAYPESTGYVTIGHEVEIRDEAGSVLGLGEEGKIFVRSAWTMLSYWDNPEATAATIGPDRFLDTGDIGRVEQGGLVYINSRARDMILRNAENIYPVEIENRLDQHPEVRESAVYGVEHQDWGQEVLAVVVAEAGALPTREALEQWCGQTLAAYKVPTAWQIRTEPLPRNPAGKVLKTVLRGESSGVLDEESA